MGKDGTDGIGRLSEKKNVYVIAQDEKTSTVYGMPHAIDAAGITDEVLPLEDIPEAIIRVTGKF
jgi:two-component system chemotaxis response regulator CheB